MTALQKDNLNPENFLKNHRRGGGGSQDFHEKMGSSPYSGSCLWKAVNWDCFSTSEENYIFKIMLH